MSNLELARGVWLAIVIVADVSLLSMIISDYAYGDIDLFDWIIAFVLVAQFVGFTYYCWF